MLITTGPKNPREQNMLIPPSFILLHRRFCWLQKILKEANLLRKTDFDYKLTNKAQ